MKAAGLPLSLAQRPLRVLRPADGTPAYAYPAPEFARLARRGVLRRVATGYYVIVPADQVGEPGWRPELEATALGIAAADYGVGDVALMGLSAARVHGAIPRALAVAVVAVPKQRPALSLLDRDAVVVFVRRAVDRLDLQRTTTSLGEGYVTTVEQTVLDLAARPELGGVPAEAGAATRALLSRADRQLLEVLAGGQRRRSTLRRLLATET